MLIFLKLGGSLITDKSEPHTPRLEVLRRTVHEIAAALKIDPSLQLLLGHGSGSFGHTSADKHKTHLGVHTSEQWRGFSEVWFEARALNQLVVEACKEAELPVISFPPSACVQTNDQRVVYWDSAPIKSALAHGLLPVVHGDVVFDSVKGGTILATEEAFTYLARELKPARILFAGLEQGVWSDYPACTHLLDLITPDIYAQNTAAVGSSAWTDVTGGMQQKVKLMLELCQAFPAISAQIFSGLQPGAITEALLGSSIGTRIAAKR